MTTRERFNRVLHWQTPDRLPNVDFGYWDETIVLWHEQGLPPHVKTNEDVERYLGLEGVEIIPWLPVHVGLFPPFEAKVLGEEGEYNIVQDGEGNITKVPKSGATTMPFFVKYGLETREDWLKYKERLDYSDPARIYGDVQEAVQKAHAAGMPIRFNAGSLYGWIRNWMGVENLSIAILTDKKWVEEMMEHLTEQTIYLIEKVFPGLDVDLAWWWEDMCYNRGPLISPKLFNELMVPRYRRVTETLRKYDVDINVLDCDGNIHELVPGWLEGGINVMFPIESAHTDVMRLRREFGKDLLLIGAVDKRALIQGGRAIDEELARLRPLAEEGGYIPSVDHRVPADVSFKNYLYYLERKKEVLLNIF